MKNRRDYKKLIQLPNEENTFSTEDGYVSRSQKKRESTALQLLGEELAKLPSSVWKNLPISSYLQEALADYRRIPSMEGKRRQLQFIGRLMREEDAPLLQAKLQEYQSAGQSQTADFHKLETLRDRLLENDPQARQDILALFPACDAKELERLISCARNNESKSASRELFRYLKSLHTSTSAVIS